MDLLSDVFRAVRLSGAVFFDVRAGAPWVAAAPASREIADRVMPGCEHVIEFHAITGGGCWGGLVDGPPIRLEAGDVIIFPHGDSHVLSSAPGLRAEPDNKRLEVIDESPRPFSLRTGSSAEDVSMVCGFLGCDARPFNPLLATLPRVLRMSGDDAERPALRLFVELAMAESEGKRIGGECMLARLSELMFVEAVRRHVESLTPEERGWLAGLRDDVVGRALSHLHSAPAHPWTLDELGRRVGMSRSAFADRFTQFLGQPPMQYLAQWRMQLAARMLREGTANIATIASETGYASEAAFSRAFKKVVGSPPAAFRRQGREA